MGNVPLKDAPSPIGRYWLIGSLLLVLLPHLSRLPLWLAVASLAVFAWRLLCDYQNVQLPGKGLRIFLTLLGVGAILVVFRTLIGREPGTALLTVMVCLKLLELRTQRDAMSVIFLGYFLVVAGFLFDESIVTGLYMFLVVLALTTTLIVLNHPAAAASRNRFYLKHAGSLLLQAVPLMVLLFILFPRITTPLWYMPAESLQGKTGLGDEMKPGDITHLADSTELVFRIKFQNTIPAADKLYWRGPVLWNTDGQRWTRLTLSQQGKISTAATQYKPIGKPLSYVVMQEPQKRPWLFALDLPSGMPAINGGAQLLPDFQMLSNRTFNERIHYSMRSSLNYRTSELDQWERNFALQLPVHANPDSRALASGWRTGNADDQAIINLALDYFRTQPFYYTRNPPALGPDPVDDFLFSSRQGFCEHYASAFVVLMRAAGIPSRVVTGYQGGEFNSVGKFLEIRQNRAHAWAEVWLSHRGWVRVDPTSVIPAERVLENQDTSRFTSLAPVSSLDIDYPMLRSSLLKLRQGWGAANYAWSMWVTGFDAERQQQLLKRLGIQKPEWGTLLVILSLLLAVVLIIIAAIVLNRQSHSNDPLVRLYRKFCRKLEKAGVELHSNLGPSDLASRAIHALPQHTPAIRAIIDGYVGLRYGRKGPIDTSQLGRLINRFRP